MANMVANVQVLQLRIDTNEESEFLEKMNARKIELGLKTDSSYLRYLIAKDINNKCNVCKTKK
jgi:hypothetical protein